MKKPSEWRNLLREETFYSQRPSICRDLLFEGICYVQGPNFRRTCSNESVFVLLHFLPVVGRHSFYTGK